MFYFLDLYPWLLPVIIFFARILDVTLGTLRIIFVSKGEKYIAPLIGFFEVLIWIVVISQIFSRANDIVAYLSYAAGYATGNFVGIFIEQKIAFGVLLIRAYTRKSGGELVALLNSEGYGATTYKGEGAKDRVEIVETVVERSEMKKVERIINGYDPGIFYVAEDVRSKQKGIFPRPGLSLFRWRPGK